jgi:EmrB/QacA subfamily drug resistance transporter
VTSENSQEERVVLIAAALTSFMTAFMGSSLNVAMPVIGREFSLTPVMLSWISTAYLMTSAALLISVGKFADIYGRIKLFKYGIVIFCCGTLLSGIASSGSMLIVFRIVQGIGSSMIFSTSTAIVVSAFPPHRRGRALGITIAAVYTGLSTGPFLGGLISSALGWRYIFFISAIYGVLLFIFIIPRIKHEWKEVAGESFDVFGALILAVIFICLLLGFSSLPKFHSYILLVSTILITIAFYHVVKHQPYPIVKLDLFVNNRTFTFSSLAALINYSATFAVGFLLSLYLQIVKGLSPKEAGIILITQPIVMAVFSPLAGRLSDKIEPQIVASIGMALITIGLAVFAFISIEFPIFWVVFILAVLGFGFALFSSPNSNAVMGSVEKKNYGVASSMLAAMRMIGQMLSMGAVIAIFALLVGDKRIDLVTPSAYIASARIAFMIFSIFCFAGIFASLARGKMHNNNSAM